MSKILEYLIEYISLIDFGTDIYVAYKLITSKNTMWAAITVNAMIAPFLASSVQMIQFFLDKVILREGEENYTLLLISYISLFPLFILFLWVMDIFFIFSTCFLEPLAFIVDQILYWA